MVRPPRRPSAEGLVSFAVVAAAMAFVVSQLEPRLLLTTTTAAGGDMGAHVWGPAYLRDVLIPQGRLTGWTPDWYAGFPAYHFYMVIPSLLIVALELVMPYEIAFKLVSVSGLVAMPLTAWAFGHLARLPFPGPPLLAVAAVGFLFDRSFTIYGGNIASTLAGEFAFSMSLAVALLFLGLVARGLDTGRNRAAAAVVLGLCGLLHIIPAFFAITATLVWLLVAWATPLWPWALGRFESAGTTGALLRRGRNQGWWVVSSGAVAGALGAFWVLPFVWRRAYMNDMGWEKLTTYLEPLFPGRVGESLSRLAGGEATVGVPGDLTWVIALAAAGVVASIVMRRRVGIFLIVLAAIAAVAFILVPQGRLWNARLLPFWYLCLYFLAAIAVAETARAAAILVARPPRDEVRGVVLAAPVVGLLAAVLFLGMGLHGLPFGTTRTEPATGATEYRWPAGRWWPDQLALATTDRSFIPGWARWNYSGYERKEAWPEYRDLVTTMAGVGQAEGCGRAMWEYESGLDRFGTPMALMLLPYWTDGCVGSMEGLYFEASATTPYHFLNQSELSVAPSRAMRGLPYGDLDLDLGIDHLQMMGVRYYMAFSEQIVEAAADDPRLTEVATSGDWHVYEVADTAPVVPLAYEPAVLTGVPRGGEAWLEPSVEWYLDRTRWDVPLAAEGLADWQRVGPHDEAERRPVIPATVTDVDVSEPDRIAFTVDRPLSPVLVRSSYFPNWEVSGGEGPFQVAPNLMVVVPTSSRVTLTYGTTPVDLVAWVITGAGIAGVLVLALRGPLHLPWPSPRRRPDDVAEEFEAGVERAVHGPDPVTVAWGPDRREGPAPSEP